MSRALTVMNLLNKKHMQFEFDGIYKQVFGKPSTNGIWLIDGKEKNGKTWAALLLANYLSQFSKVLYVSAEEGFDMEFADAVHRANIDPKNKNLHFVEYEPLEELYERLNRRKAPKIVVLDNLTIYSEEMKANGIKKLIKDFPNILFLCLAHLDRGKPYTSTAQMASKLAKVLIRVEGLTMIVGGRVPGGRLMINEKKAMLYHGAK